MAGKSAKALEDQDQQDVIHRKGCPKARYGAGGVEVDLYESYDASGPAGKARVTRCMLCGAHHVVRADGTVVDE